MTTRSHFPRRVEKRKTEAAERQRIYNALSPGERLDKLNAKLGFGVGARKQRMRIGGV